MMTPGLAFLIAELTKMGIQLAMQHGSLDTLTQADAEATIKKIADSLQVTLPSPEDLEAGPPPA